MRFCPPPIEVRSCVVACGPLHGGSPHRRVGLESRDEEVGMSLLKRLGRRWKLWVCLSGMIALAGCEGGYVGYYSPAPAGYSDYDYYYEPGYYGYYAPGYYGPGVYGGFDGDWDRGEWGHREHEEFEHRFDRGDRGEFHGRGEGGGAEGGFHGRGFARGGGGRRGGGHAAGAHGDHDR
jgi:hypothetical protein